MNIMSKREREKKASHVIWLMYDVCMHTQY
jgi:hypothetical protein